ncbi:LPS translocon maturation chaperone LptM [Diaphorobacter sp. ED-3]|uniref:LPS translocon maturation chaperone LptM n=1 Tax=Diaphorobacter sp. ED-3 TaxID=3016636 RepID=UPI003FA435BE
MASRLVSPRQINRARKKSRVHEKSTWFFVIAIKVGVEVEKYNLRMFRARQILVRTIVLAVSTAAFAACGQRGPLYLPTDPAAAQRATLPETLNPTASRAPASSPADSASTTRP